MFLVKRRIERIEVLGVETVCYDSQGFAETLIMYNFPLTQEFYRISDVGIFGKPKYVVIYCTRFLFRRHVLMQVRNRIALYLNVCRGKGIS